MGDKVTVKERMELPQAPDEVFALITDLDAVAPCVPGARLNPPDDNYTDGTRTGEIVLGFGPIRYRYEGTIRITETDPAAKRVSYEAAGTETSGEGTLGVEMTMEIGESANDGSGLDVTAEVAVTGMVAEYGLGMVEEVARDVISQFVSAMRARHEANMKQTAATTGAPSAPAAGEPATPAPAPQPIGGFRMLLRVTFRRLRRKLRDLATRLARRTPKGTT